jgi:hypothetical protein
MTRSQTLFGVFAASSVLAFVAASGDASQAASLSDYALAGSISRDPLRQYGAPVKLGEGKARAYVERDARTYAPIELGVALDEKALDGLPSAGSGHHGTHAMETHEFLLQLPKGHGTPFKFVEMNWNPAGHEPEGVYQDVPHFDFHFYTVPKAVRDGIVPTDSQFSAKANALPAKEFIPQYALMLAPPGAQPKDVAVPKMGVHWVDVRAAELQKLLGKPEAYKPFTATFLHGTWNGQVHFWEPMITRAHLVEKKATTDARVRDQVIPIGMPSKYQKPGYYPNAYRITWDAQAKEYRVALTGLAKRG